MRVLQVHTRYREPGGEDSVVAEERALLREAGHVVECLEFQNPTEAGAAFRKLISSPWNAAAARHVVHVAKEMRPDVVHVHNSWFALSNAVFPEVSGAGFPVVATIHNYRLACVNALFYRDEQICQDCLGKVPWRGVAYRCYRQSALQSAAVAVGITTHRVRRTWHRDVDVVVALTAFARDTLIASGVPSSRIVVKPNSVRDPGPRPALPSSSSEVVFVGSLLEGKGVFDLVTAWKRADLPGMRLSIIGEGPVATELSALAGDGIDLVGRLPRSDVHARLLGARAIVVPSRWFEVMPVSLLEGLAAGLPVVVSAHGALVETAGEAAVPFPGGDPDALAKALEEVADDQSVDELGAAARARYERLFSSAAGLRSLMDAYLRAMEPDAERGRTA